MLLSIRSATRFLPGGVYAHAIQMLRFSFKSQYTSIRHIDYGRKGYYTGGCFALFIHCLGRGKIVTPVQA
jgi:hypothetical protein